MLELLAATVIISTALIPALRLTSRSLRDLDEIEKSELCLAFCTSEMEFYLAKTSEEWSLTRVQGDFSADGYPDIRKVISRSRETVEEIADGELAAITVLVWHDQNRDGRPNQGEPHAELSTKLARVTSYEYESDFQ